MGISELHVRLARCRGEKRKAKRFQKEFKSYFQILGEAAVLCNGYHIFPETGRQTDTISARYSVNEGNIFGRNQIIVHKLHGCQVKLGMK